MPLIRSAVSTDAPKLVTLQQSVYDEGRWFVGDGPPDPAVLTRRLRSREPTMSLFLVAQLPGDELVAWLELHRLFPQKLKHVATLTLAVKKTHRRQGLATRLLQKAYGWTRENGVRKISLNVRANNVEAIRLYEAQGFELEGRERAHVRVRDGFEDNIIMAKHVGEKDTKAQRWPA